jgi:hypothetical protein
VARQKREGESFSKVIDPLVDSSAQGHSCADAVRESSALWGAGLSSDEADIMHAVVRSNREFPDWKAEWE